MSVSTYKGTVENGVIKLEINIKLPEKTEVYVVVPEEKPKMETELITNNKKKQ